MTAKVKAETTNAFQKAIQDIQVPEEVKTMAIRDFSGFLDALHSAEESYYQAGLKKEKLELFPEFSFNTTEEEEKMMTDEIAHRFCRESAVEDNGDLLGVIRMEYEFCLEYYRNGLKAAQEH